MVNKKKLWKEYELFFNSLSDKNQNLICFRLEELAKEINRKV